MPHHLRLTPLEDRTAPSASLIADLNRDPNFADPFAHGGTVYFSKVLPETGGELWKADPDTGTTELLKDLRPGPDGSQVRFLAAAGGRIFLEARTAAGGGALWRTDGTTAGTVRLSITGSNSSARIEEAVVFQGRLYYSLDREVLGKRSQLWASDGTVGGTKLVKTIGHVIPPSFGYDGYQSDPIRDLTVLDDRLYFFAEDRDGHALWWSDGTANGTRQEATLFGTPADLEAHSEALFFRDPQNKVWRLDPGTNEPPSLVTYLGPGRQPRS